MFVLLVVSAFAIFIALALYFRKLQRKAGILPHLKEKYGNLLQQEVLFYRNMKVVELERFEEKVGLWLDAHSGENSFHPLAGVG